MSLLRTSWLVAAGLLAVAGCTIGSPGDTDPPPPPPPPGTPPPPPPEPPPPTPTVYKRGSLSPEYRLTPSLEFNRFIEFGIAMKSTDFTSNLGNFTSVTARLDNVAAQIAAEEGKPTLDLIPIPEDRQRAQQMPFRGNPSDVDFFAASNGERQVWVPLGGDLMTPGNEVAVVNLNNVAAPAQRVQVGVRPQRIAVHPAGLIFVCNQFSNYITVIDPVRRVPFRNRAGENLEIKTEFYCADLAFVPRNPAAPDVDEQDLYVANAWRASILKYSLEVERGVDNAPVDIRLVEPTAPNPANQPTAEIFGVGSNPYRIAVGQDLRSLYVANNRGGEVARVDLNTRTAKRIVVNAPVPDIAQLNDLVIMATTTIDRGLPDVNDNIPSTVDAEPAEMPGVDGQRHVVHPGALRDNTRAYNFEDLRNGMLTADFQLNQTPRYFTDDISPERNFLAQQKILKGSIPQAIALNAARDRAFVAMSGSDTVQEFRIQGGNFRLADAGGVLYQTDRRPFAVQVIRNAAGNNDEILVASWGGEVLEVFDRGVATAKARINLGYASARYPATQMEIGEFLFYNTSWSNNGRKSCAGCHIDELLLDGVPYANGATAPTAYHKVTANFNLMTSDSYFWNGSFANGSYASLASDAQARSNCELILFGLIEGIDSDPNTRIGDPNNRISNDDDDLCRPDTSGAGTLPVNFDEIAQVIADQKILRDDVVRAATAVVGGVDFATATRLVDYYSVHELRLPPNPNTYMVRNNMFDSATMAKVAKGQQLFDGAGCGSCHNPLNQRAPFTDGKNHGDGANWVARFIAEYGDDQRLIDIIGAIPENMSFADAKNQPSGVGREINLHLDPIDYFAPFCFDSNECLVFEDPIAVKGNLALETDRLETLIVVNLANVDRGFVPGNVRGQPQVNTPSLRGIWFQTNFLRHGHARSLQETILPPGHSALKQGELGYAVDDTGTFDVHGRTQSMSNDDVDALYLYLTTIQ